MRAGRSGLGLLYVGLTIAPYISHTRTVLKDSRNQSRRGPCHILGTPDLAGRLPEPLQRPWPAREGFRGALQGLAGGGQWPGAGLGALRVFGLRSCLDRSASLAIIGGILSALCYGGGDLLGLFTGGWSGLGFVWHT